MRPLSDREKRLIRYSGIGIAVYLALFFVLKPLQKHRAEYGELQKKAVALRHRVQPYGDRALVVQKLMEDFQLDPARLSRATVVGEVSVAIQKAAGSSGIQVGPVRESPARLSSKELASVQMEGIGPVPAVMGLLQRLGTLGYPLIIDSVQLTPETRGPGRVKVNLTIVILDFEQWKKEEKPHA